MQQSELRVQCLETRAIVSIGGAVDLRCQLSVSSCTDTLQLYVPRCAIRRIHAKFRDRETINTFHFRATCLRRQMETYSQSCCSGWKSEVQLGSHAAPSHFFSSKAAATPKDSSMRTPFLLCQTGSCQVRFNVSVTTLWTQLFSTSSNTQCPVYP